MHFLILLAAGLPVVAAPATVQDYAAYIQEASQKTGLPVAIIRAVMATESAQNAHAVSAKGAMGLMQLMPRTWESLRQQYGLGPDPFDPHDNILAGAYYLRALYDRYGPDGFLAAYNAGPGRWEKHRDTGQTLPAETRTYVATITQKLGANVLTFAPTPETPKQPSWMEAALFLPMADDPSASPLKPSTAGNTPFVELSPTPSEFPQQ